MIRGHKTKRSYNTQQMTRKFGKLNPSDEINETETGMMEDSLI